MTLSPPHYPKWSRDSIAVPESSADTQSETSAAPRSPRRNVTASHDSAFSCHRPHSSGGGRAPRSIGRPFLTEIGNAAGGRPSSDVRHSSRLWSALSLCRPVGVVGWSARREGRVGRREMVAVRAVGAPGVIRPIGSRDMDRVIELLSGGRIGRESRRGWTVHVTVHCRFELRSAAVVRTSGGQCSRVFPPETAGCSAARSGLSERTSQSEHSCMIRSVLSGQSGRSGEGE